MFFNKRKETESTLKARNISLRKAENKVEELSNENKLLFKENRKMKNLLSDIHKLSLTHLIGYEKVTLEKIKELTRGY